MKKLTTVLLLSLLILACDVVQDYSKNVTETINSTTGTDSKPSLTNDEVIAGLKEALQVGIDSATSKVSGVGGYGNNSLIQLFLPESANDLKEQAERLGLKSQVDKVESTLNEAAELASKEAVAIFIEAIKGMSVQDGFAILNGGENSATEFLKKGTSSALTAKFNPIILNSMEKVQVTKYWKPVVSKYNTYAKLKGKTQVEENLDQYVTQKAIDGLFVMLAKEEAKIRVDPIAQVTNLLKKVFGS
jgi:hypothetical protein